MEVAWCRQYAEQIDAEYGVMIADLIGENEQLESLVRLLARQLDASRISADATMGTPPLVVGVGGGEVSARLEDLLQIARQLLTQRVEEINALQRDLGEERLEAQTLRRRLEEALQELASVRGQAAAAALAGASPWSRTSGSLHCDATIASSSMPADLPSSGCSDNGAGLGNGWPTRLAQLERARAHETRRLEITESRSALIENRCQQFALRLEGELAATTKVGGTVPTDKLHNYQNLADAIPSATDLGAQLRQEREAYRDHIALQSRYLDELAATCGQPLPNSIMTSGSAHRASTDLKALEGAKFAHDAPSLANRLRLPRSEMQHGSVHDPPGSPTYSDDEDYAWEGYLEFASGSCSFDKVYAELSRTQLLVSSDRLCEDPPLFICSLVALPMPAQIRATDATGTRCGRCFELSSRQADGAGAAAGLSAPRLFRCVTERRAEQWTEAINRAWTRCRRSPSSFDGSGRSSA